MAVHERLQHTADALRGGTGRILRGDELWREDGKEQQDAEADAMEKAWVHDAIL
jgi:hypothetical protein